jgi:hypothetical protein
MATQSRSGADGLRQAQLDPLLAPFDPLLDAGDAIHVQLGAQLDFAYVARQLAHRGQAARAADLERTLANPGVRALVAAQRHAAAGDAGAARDALRAALAAQPGDAQARFLLLQALGSGTPQAEIHALLAGLDGPARAVVDGWQLLARGDWPALQALDAALAQSRSSDVWYAAAARLRALWRVNAPGADAARAREALRLLDPALVVAEPAELFPLYQLRAQCAAAAGDTDVLVESARDIVASVRGNLERAGAALHPGQLALLRQSLDDVTRALDSDLPDSARERASAVRNEAGALRARLGS